MTAYTYSISTDTANAKVDLQALTEEVKDSAIVTALGAMAAAGDVLDIAFKETLSGEDETILDGIVSAHTGDPIDPPPMQVQIVEEHPKKKTGGNFAAETLSMSVPTGTGPHTKEFSWPYPVSILAVLLQPKANEVGDSVKAVVAERTDVGTVSTNIAQNDTVINVSQGVVNKMKIGHHCEILESSTHHDLGYVIAVNKAANTITVQTPAPEAIVSGSTVEKTRIYIPRKVMRSTAAHTLGRSKIGGTHIAANKKLKIYYTNNEGNAKTFDFDIERLS